MRQLYIILSFAGIILLLSCHTPQKKWQPINPEVDSINVVLDRIYSDSYQGNTQSLIKRLSEISDSLPDNKDLKAIILYWRVAFEQGIYPDSIKIWKNKIREFVDSATYPYLIARMDLINKAPIDKSNFLTRHKRLIEIIDYFEHIGDKRMQMVANRYLSSFYATIGDMEKYKECAEHINNLCQQLGNDTLIAKSTLNLALAEIHVGDSAKAREILTSLLESPLVNEDSVFRSRIYVNLGELTSDPEYFQKAIDFNRTFREVPDYYYTLKFSMMKKYESRGEYAKSDSLFTILYPIVMIDGDANAKIISHQILLRQAIEKGDYRRVAEEQDSISRFKEETMSSTQFEKLTSNSYKMELAKQEEKVEKERSMALLLIIGITAGSIILVSGLLFFLRKQRIKMKRKEKEDSVRLSEIEQQLDKEKSSALAMTLSIEERDKLIRNISRITESVNEEGGIDANNMKQLLNSLKTSQMSINEWDDFHTAYAKVHPLFLKRLKESYPDITEGDSRLALYIAAGLSSKEIARIMQIQPDSIKKNRQRLRQRMHISSNDELESILRNLL
ncbi:MAG: helix-turn-helix transcriptional regulator [Muribaculaceae bacterium]|nr:helix-turn-helix transcriptional regulator [Muribaculaceae bacterium]